MTAAHTRGGPPGPGELIADLILSLDGCAAGEGWPGWWGLQSQKAGLVDRFRVVLFPVITGRTGLERIWEQFEDYSLELLAARTFEGGLQLLEYAPTHLERPPGTGWERTAADGA